MAKYRKKPVVIEAVQYNNSNYEEVNSFVGQRLNRDLESETAYLAGQGAPMFSLTIPTLEGNMKAMPADWVIKGVNGEFYPCKPDIFEKTYEPVYEDGGMSDPIYLRTMKTKGQKEVEDDGTNGIPYSSEGRDNPY